jgi:hypothetical protein
MKKLLGFLTIACDNQYTQIFNKPYFITDGFNNRCLWRLSPKEVVYSENGKCQH